MLHKVGLLGPDLGDLLHIAQVSPGPAALVWELQLEGRGEPLNDPRRRAGSPLPWEDVMAEDPVATQHLSVRGSRCTKLGSTHLPLEVPEQFRVPRWL